MGTCGTTGGGGRSAGARFRLVMTGPPSSVSGAAAETLVPLLVATSVGPSSAMTVEDSTTTTSPTRGAGKLVTVSTQVIEPMPSP